MEKPLSWDGQFIQHLEGLRNRKERGALAVLRRGLGKPPGDAIDMFPLVIPYVPAEANSYEVECYFIVASLFAMHDQPGGTDDLGSHFAALKANNGRSVQSGEADPLERRFVALLATHVDDLAYHLRQAVTLLRTGEVPVNWLRLLGDIQRWGDPDRPVQRRWARSFWASIAPPAS